VDETPVDEIEPEDSTLPRGRRGEIKPNVIDASWSSNEIWAYALRRDRTLYHMFNENDFHDMSSAEFEKAAENCEKIIINVKRDSGVGGVNKLAVGQLKGLLEKSQEEISSMTNMEMLLANEIIRNSSPANNLWQEIQESQPVES
jgi:hypothetical protein